MSFERAIRAVEPRRPDVGFFQEKDHFVSIITEQFGAFSARMIKEPTVLLQGVGLSDDLETNIADGKKLAVKLLPSLTDPERGAVRFASLVLDLGNRPGISPAFVTALMARVWAGLVMAHAH